MRPYLDPAHEARRLALLPFEQALALPPPAPPLLSQLVVAGLCEIVISYAWRGDVLVRRVDYCLTATGRSEIGALLEERKWPN